MKKIPGLFWIYLLWKTIQNSGISFHKKKVAQSAPEPLCIFPEVGS